MKPTNYKPILTSGAREIAQWLLRNQGMPKKAILRYRLKTQPTNHPKNQTTPPPPKKKPKKSPQKTTGSKFNKFNANETLKHILSWLAKLTLAEDGTRWSAEVISSRYCVVISSGYLLQSIGLHGAEDIQCIVMQTTRNPLAGKSLIRQIGVKIGEEKTSSHAVN